MNNIAIVIICYNRLFSVKRLIKSLENVDFRNRSDIKLIFSIDYSGDSSIEEFATDFKWKHGEKEIITYNQRQGLRNHVINVGDLTSQYDMLIVLEDDVIVSDSMFSYAYEATLEYFDNEKIAGISLYNFSKNWLRWYLRFEPFKNGFDNYFMKIAQSWGQVWTYNKWSKFKEWYDNNVDKIDLIHAPKYLKSWPESSWLKYHTLYLIDTDKYFVYPYISLSSNFSDAGQHSNKTISDHQVELQWGKQEYKLSNFNSESIIYDEYMNPMFISFENINNSDLEIDFYQTKEKQNNRFLLTTNKKNYKVIKKFGLQLRPIELNIILNIKGNELFLYDTSIKKNNKNKINNNLIIYFSRTSEIKYSRLLLYYSIKYKLSRIYNKIKGKIKK